MKISLRFAAALVVSLATATACYAQGGLAERVQEYTLKNGMKVLLVPRHTSPTVAAWIRFKVGSVDERSDERGLAHRDGTTYVPLKFIAKALGAEVKWDNETKTIAITRD